MSTYEEMFPPDRKPPPVPNYGGSKLFKAKTPVYNVPLDAGAMRAVWELLEAEAKHRYPTHATMTGVEALLRAVTAFRKSFWAWPDNEKAFQERFTASAIPKQSIAKAVLAKHKAVPTKKVTPPPVKEQRTRTIRRRPSGV